MVVLIIPEKYDKVTDYCFHACLLPSLQGPMETSSLMRRYNDISANWEPLLNHDKYATEWWTKQRGNRLYHVRILLEYNSLLALSTDITPMLQGFEGYK